MKVKRSFETCCLDADGRKLAFHLCCVPCRDALAAAERAALLARPTDCSTEVPIAPARGAVSAFHDRRMVAVGVEDFQEVAERYVAGPPGIARDNFDLMTDQAMKRKGAKPPFSAAEVHAGREYRALHHRIASSGLKLSSTFDVRTGGGSVDFMDAYIRDHHRLGRFHAAIGPGVAKDTRRSVDAMQGRVVVGAAQVRDIGREIILARRLVDMVCLEEKSLSDVLKRHRWSLSTANLNSLRASLCAALGRMQGV